MGRGKLRSLGEATEWSREGGAWQVALYLPTFPPPLKSESMQSECCIPHLPYMTPCIVNQFSYLHNEIKS